MLSQERCVCFWLAVVFDAALPIIFITVYEVCVLLLSLIMPVYHVLLSCNVLYICLRTSS